MGLYKIFKDVFYETMTRHGFIHQGNVFIRINGKDIVQAVTIKPIIGYDITAAIFPLYLPCKGFNNKYVLPKKPYWAEDRILSFHGYADFPHVNCSEWIEKGIERRTYSLTPFFNKDEFLSDTIENLQKAAEIMETFYIPQFDKIVDFDSYFEWINIPIKERALRSVEIITAETLVYKSYLDGNFDWGNEYIDNLRIINAEQIWEMLKCYKKYDNKKFLEQDFAEDVLRRLKINKSISEFDFLPAKFTRNCEDFENRVLADRYREFFDSAANNDSSWIIEYLDNNRKRTAEVLKSTYSKLLNISI